MPKKPSVAQRKRAGQLRKIIGALNAGERPPDVPPKTPREITDEAARRKARRSSRG
jgi:hypothetical protein